MVVGIPALFCGNESVPFTKWLDRLIACLNNLNISYRTLSSAKQTKYSSWQYNRVGGLTSSAGELETKLWKKKLFTEEITVCDYRKLWFSKLLSSPHRKATQRWCSLNSCFMSSAISFLWKATEILANDVIEIWLLLEKYFIAKEKIVPELMSVVN